MDITEIKKEAPDTVEVCQTEYNVAGGGLKLEISEIGSPIPFKIIKVENENGEPNIFRMELPLQSQWTAGPSTADQLATDPHSSTSPPPNKRIKPDLKHNSTNKPKNRLRLENNNCMEITSGDDDDDAFSSESDVEYGEDSESESESEYISDDDALCAGDQGQDTKIDDILDWWRVNPPEWTTEDVSMKNIQFTKKRELFKPAPKTPYETFRWLLNDQILDTIANETNKYAFYILTRKNVARTSRFKAWRDVTREELITFLALLIHTGTIRTNRLADYWKGDYLFNFNCFSRFMTRNRFMLILNCLNFASLSPDSETLRVWQNNMAKINPFVKNFNDVMKEIYYPGKELLIAKSMVFWHGCLVRQEYTDHRRYRKAVSLSKLAEPNGIVVKFLINVERNTDNIFRVSSGKIVEELLAEKLGCGHSVYMGRYYSSYRLALTLLERQTYCTGTLNKKSRNNPFREGNITTQAAETPSNRSFFSNGVHVGKWRSKKSTLYITTEFKNQIYQYSTRNGTATMTPKALANYSRFMTSNELEDQLMSYMPCSRKKMPWHKKAFIYALQIYMNNAFHLFKNFSGNTKKMDYYEYRLCVLKAMLPVSAPTPPTRTPLTDVPAVSLPLAHVLTRIARTRQREKKNRDGTVRIVNEVVRRECTACRRRRQRTSTTYECAACKGSPAFCSTCFCEVHVSTNTPYTMNI